MLTKNDYKLHSEQLLEWWLQSQKRVNELEAQVHLLELKLKKSKKKKNKC